MQFPKGLGLSMTYWRKKKRTICALTQIHFSFQLAALVVLGISIWILVDQPSFLKVLNVTDDVVGGFDVSYFLFKTN